MPFSQLAAKLEAATRPCAILDAEIALAVGWRNGGGYTDGGLAVLASILDQEHEEVRERAASDLGLPRWTRSMDAALLLKPEGHRWSLADPGFDDGRYQGGRARADVHHPMSSGGGPKWKSFGAGPALALSAAFLKARRPV